MLKKIIISLLIIIVNISYGFSQKSDQPEPPVLDTVSVDPTTGTDITVVFICWFPSPSTDVVGYIIYREEGIDTWIAIDTIWGADSTCYIDSTSDADDHPESYCVVAIDSSDETSPMCPPHTTIYTFPYFFICPHRIEVDWTEYKGWTNGVFEYRIYVKIDTQETFLLGTVPGNITSYIHYIDDTTSYSYYVQAVNQDGRTASSNNIRITPVLPSVPKYINANFATVSGYNEVKLSFSIDTVDIEYKLLKSENIQGPYDTIAQFTVLKKTEYIEYTDYVKIYYDICYYKLVAIDICGDVVEGTRLTNLINNIVLKVFNNNDLTHTLKWNDYLGTYDNFNIYRIVDEYPAEFIGSVSYGETIYIDNVLNYQQTQTEGDFCYYVEAILDTLQYGIECISRSNISCASQFPRIFIPDAFNPDSEIEKNRIFQPYVSYASPDDYIFIIYNRWGEKIFETNNTQQGWDGKINNKFTESGTYVYYIKFSTAENKVFEKSGFVTLFYH